MRKDGEKGRKEKDAYLAHSLLVQTLSHLGPCVHGLGLPLEAGQREVEETETRGEKGHTGAATFISLKVVPLQVLGFDPFGSHNSFSLGVRRLTLKHA